MTTASFRIFLFILAFAPLAFGTVEHWSMTTVQLLTAVSLLLCLLGLGRARLPVLEVPGILPLGLLTGLIFLQLVPLPPLLIKAVSPASWEAYRPVYELSGSSAWTPVSVNRGATLQELLRIGSYTLFYILTVQLLRTSARIRLTLKYVAFLAAGIAFFAIIQQFSSAGLIYWFRPAPGGHPGGPWININQYAAFIGALSPLVLALFLLYRPNRASDASWRERFVTLFSSPASNLYLWLGFSFVLLVFSVFVSLCRGGILTTLAALVIFAALLGYKRRNYSQAGFWVLLCLVLIAVSWFGWQPIVDEFDRAFDVSGAVRDARFQLWGDTLAMIRVFALLGSGFGTFVDVYPSFKTISAYLLFEHAHNDYLELLATGGVLGFTLALWFCGAVLVHSWRKIMARKDRLVVLVGLGSLVGISALLMHSLVDFNLQNGAVGLYFFFLCGVLVAVANNRYQHYTEVSLLPRMGVRRHKMLILTAGFFLIAAAVVQFGILLAANSYARVSGIYVSRYLAPDLAGQVDDALRGAMRFDPLNGIYPYRRSGVAQVQGNLQDASAYALDAARLQPMKGEYLQRVAALLPPGSENKAEELMREAYRRALDKDSLAHDWAEWLLLKGRRDQAMEVVKERLADNARLLDRVIPLFESWSFTPEEMAALMPPSPAAWIHYGDYLEKTGRLLESRYFRSEALEFLDGQEKIEAGWFTQLISYYRRHGPQNEAVEVIRRGIDYLPDYAPFHAWLGDYYRDEGITFRAREEYERAVLLDPKNKSYRQRLQAL